MKYGTFAHLELAWVPANLRNFNGIAAFGLMVRAISPNSIDEYRLRPMHGATAPNTGLANFPPKPVNYRHYHLLRDGRAIELRTNRGYLPL